MRFMRFMRFLCSGNFLGPVMGLGLEDGEEIQDDEGTLIRLHLQ